MSCFEELKAHLESLQSNIDRVNAQKTDLDGELENEIEQARQRIKERGAELDKQIASYQNQIDNGNFTLQMLEKLAAEHEEEMQKVRKTNSAAAGVLCEAIETGGGGQEDLVTFFRESRDIDAPEGFNLPEPQTAEEEQQEEEPAQAQVA